jgi:hypothetical protein
LTSALGGEAYSALTNGMAATARHAVVPDGSLGRDAFRPSASPASRAAMSALETQSGWAGRPYWARVGRMRGNIAKSASRPFETIALTDCPKPRSLSCRCNAVYERLRGATPFGGLPRRHRTLNACAHMVPGAYLTKRSWVYLARLSQMT